MIAYAQYVYKEKCPGRWEGKRKDKPKGVKAQGEGDWGNLVSKD